LTRTLHHPHYTFRKKLSHTADSQDQRHRMTPGSRPMLTAYLTDEPDYITPILMPHNPEAHALYQETMARTWEAINQLRALGAPDEYAAYLLPNAVSIRFTESGDLMSLHHKLRLRLCYNAQEEIFFASKDEAMQIAAVNPLIGQYLGAPCTLRHAAGARPICPEGERYCGIPVWKLAIKDYERVL
jgi:thymidylate synthase ThyX